MRFRAALIQLISLGVWASPTALDLVKRQEPQEPSNTIIPSPVNHTANIDACQGYQLTNATVRSDSTGVDGTLTILGNCSAYGPDYPTLTLSVSFETADRLRVRITDTQNKAHIVPDDVASWPAPGTNKVDNGTSNLDFQWQENPFGFKVVRKSDGEVLFNTIGQKLVFEEQFVRFSSKLSEGSNIQGLGQHNDNFTYVGSIPLPSPLPVLLLTLSLPIQVANYTRTLWTRDSYSVPSKQVDYAYEASTDRQDKSVRSSPDLRQPKGRTECLGSRCLPAELARNGRQISRIRPVHRVQHLGRYHRPVLPQWTRTSGCGSTGIGHLGKGSRDALLGSRLSLVQIRL